MKNQKIVIYESIKIRVEKITIDRKVRYQAFVNSTNKVLTGFEENEAICTMKAIKCVNQTIIKNEMVF